MILAAGRGERLRPLTDTCPKALVEVAGMSLLERHLHRLRGSGIREVVINLGWCGERILERVGSGERYGLTVTYSPEGENILETGGGIRRALPLLGPDPFWVVNADVFTDFRLREQGLASGVMGHLVLVPRPRHRDDGDFGLDGDRVTNGPDRPWTFSGMAVYRPELFADHEPGRFPLAPLLRQAADQRALSGELFAGEWHDVGTPERLAALNNELTARR
jgi:MurNAc alpha-1-phosphate uridylyltransferase